MTNAARTIGAMRYTEGDRDWLARVLVAEQVERSRRKRRNGWINFAIFIGSLAVMGTALWGLSMLVAR